MFKINSHFLPGYFKDKFYLEGELDQHSMTSKVHSQTKILHFCDSPWYPGGQDHILQLRYSTKLFFLQYHYSYIQLAFVQFGLFSHLTKAICFCKGSSHKFKLHTMFSFHPPRIGRYKLFKSDSNFVSNNWTLKAFKRSIYFFQVKKKILFSQLETSALGGKERIRDYLFLKV